MEVTDTVADVETVGAVALWSKGLRVRSRMDCARRWDREKPEGSSEGGCSKAWTKDLKEGTWIGR